MFRKVLLFTILAGLLLYPVSAAVLIKLSDDTLIKGAETIVAGSVVDARSRYGVNSRGDELIYTDVAVEGEALKGESASIYVFTVEGGRINQIQLTATHMPKFEVGEQVVVFLAMNRAIDNSLPTVYGELQGKFSIDEHGFIAGKGYHLENLKVRIKQQLEK